jgi:lysophospholipase L1-like esterase
MVPTLPTNSTSSTTTARRLPDRRAARRRAAVLAIVGFALFALVGGAAAQAGSKTRVTVIGDSVTASFNYVPAAKRYLGKGLDLRSDAVVCRRLVAASCPFQGSTPSTALQVVDAEGPQLGSVVVINVGYNDWPAVYDVNRVMRALRAAGVHTVIWVTLREVGTYASVYKQSNARIRSADAKWRNSLVVADWNRYSRGKSWFDSDGLHLTPTGALALAKLLRPLVLANAQ